MRVTWVCNETIPGHVSWGRQDKLTFTAAANNYTYTAGNFEGTIFTGKAPSPLGLMIHACSVPWFTMHIHLNYIVLVTSRND